MFSLLLTSLLIFSSPEKSSNLSLTLSTLKLGEEVKDEIFLPPPISGKDILAGRCLIKNKFLYELTL